MNVNVSKKGVLFLILIILVLFLALSGVPRIDKAMCADKDTYKNLKLFNQVLDMIENDYVEEVDSKTVIEGAIKGMIKTLDPHSVYLTPEMYKDLSVSTKGVFGGLGIEITLVDDIITVVAPLEDTPAYRAGLKAGDQIVGIDGESTKGFTIYDAVHKLRGTVGTTVTISIMREGFDQPKEYEITRDKIKIQSVKNRVFEDGIGYIRLTNFQETTTQELEDALDEISIKDEPLKGMVLDMRNNPGGLLTQAVRVSDIFLSSGVIVSSKGRQDDSEKIFKAQDDGDEVTCPMVVLINGGTASASEIVAGALQDNGRALILGTQSFGKGSVQIVTPLSDGSALKLTVAKYYTPSGTSIQAKGIAPDIVVESVDHRLTAKEKIKRLREKDLKNHIEGEGETIEEPEGTPDEGGSTDETDEISEDIIGVDLEKDLQLKTAVDILKSWQILKKQGTDRAS
ncbi:MAG: S41 family peptidase [Deltaproteobacteria bacterium]|nr:S41 family peptidase [Deltaproteobacteria bacterium]